MICKNVVMSAGVTLPLHAHKKKVFFCVWGGVPHFILGVKNCIELRA